MHKPTLLGRAGLKFFAPGPNEKGLAELIPVIDKIQATGILDMAIHRISGKYGQITIQGACK